MPTDCSDLLHLVRIREELRARSDSQVDAVLHAYVDGQLIGALDFTRTSHRIHINVIYVKPDFRHRGVARALLTHLSRHYPDRAIAPENLKPPHS
jgi:ribosomal protein S18 acetylase RimI-like enzyme